MHGVNTLWRPPLTAAPALVHRSVLALRKTIRDCAVRVGESTWYHRKKGVVQEGSRSTRYSEKIARVHHTRLSRREGHPRDDFTKLTRLYPVKAFLW